GLGLCGLMWCRVGVRLPRLRFGDFLCRVRRKPHPTNHYNSMEKIKQGSTNAQKKKQKTAFF
ncbi:hypothetical protein ACVGX7_11965, partial [Enterobacter hormaechei]